MDQEEAKRKIREALDAAQICYQCCICKQEVESPGVAAVLLIKNWDGPEEGQKAQQWFAHPDCFLTVVEDA